MTADQKPSSNGTAAPATLRAEKLIGGGRALAHHDGKTWMVAGALPGETVLAQPTRRRAGIIEAETLEVLESPHAARDRDPCPHSDRCGGCDWPHIKARGGPTLQGAGSFRRGQGNARPRRPAGRGPGDNVTSGLSAPRPAALGPGDPTARFLRNQVATGHVH